MELDVVSYLNNDSNLDAALGVSVGNSKIYPYQMPQGTQAPYITYRITRMGTAEENLNEAAMEFDCVSDSYLTARTLRDRLVYLLDRQDQIRNLISSASYRFYWCKFTDGESDIDIKQNYYILKLIFNIKYAEL